MPVGTLVVGDVQIIAIHDVDALMPLADAFDRGDPLLGSGAYGPAGDGRNRMERRISSEIATSRLDGSDPNAT